MRFFVTAILAVFCAYAWLTADVQAQIPQTVAIGFRNRTDFNLLVKGYTVVNGVQRSGPSLAMRKIDGVAFDANVPMGTRYYTVYDANQPQRVYLREFPIFVQNRDILISIVPSPTDPKTVIFVLGK